MSTYVPRRKPWASSGCAGKVEFKADLAMYAVVGFETVPPAPIGANEDRADAGQHINTGNNEIAPLVCPFHARP